MRATAGVDTIQDFTQNTDLLKFSNAEFNIGALSDGVNLVTEFGNTYPATQLGSGASLVLLSNAGGGDAWLYYDADGAGNASAPEQIAILTGFGGQALFSTNFDIVA